MTVANVGASADNVFTTSVANAASLSGHVLVSCPQAPGSVSVQPQEGGPPPQSWVPGVGGHSCHAAFKDMPLAVRVRAEVHAAREVWAGGGPFLAVWSGTVVLPFLPDGHTVAQGVGATSICPGPASLGLAAPNACRACAFGPHTPRSSCAVHCLPHAHAVHQGPCTSSLTLCPATRVPSSVCAQSQSLLWLLHHPVYLLQLRPSVIWGDSLFASGRCQGMGSLQ